MPETAFVTGGAGFIGSHLVDALLAEGHHVTVFDNFSTGERANLAEADGHANLTIVQGDVLDAAALEKAMAGHDVVYHLAADPDVRASGGRAGQHLEQNVIATHRVLEAMRATGVGRIAFTSTSTVYGDADVIPTPESYGPLAPISIYGASKLASEALISSFCHTFDLAGISFRFANVVGPRSNHGVTYDFVQKLRKDPTRLEILGDGLQKKSYCHVRDTVSAIRHAMTHADLSPSRYHAFNIGSADAVDVREIARIVVDEGDLGDVAFAFTGGVDGGRGWKGDVKVMQLAIDRLRDLGWTPEHGSADAIRATARALWADARA